MQGIQHFDIRPNLIHLLESRGYTIIKDVKSNNYLDGMLKLLGNEGAIHSIATPHMMRLLSNAQLRKGQAYTFAQLQQIAKPTAQVELFREMTAYLVRCSILERGYRFQCRFCMLDAWYEMQSITENMPCRGCHTKTPLALDADFAYRLNPLFAMGLKSGLLSVLLLIQYYYSFSAWYWQKGFVLRKGGMTTDIDLIIRLEDKIRFYECKDNFKTDPETIQMVCDQLATLGQIATDAGAELVFATLVEPPLPGSLQEFLDAHNIASLTAQDLLPKSG